MTNNLFYILSTITIFSGILTIIMGKNPINSVVYLVACFINCASVFILMTMDLIGLIYIIVYVGAIAILFIFVIMMMDLRNITAQSNELSSDSRTYKVCLPLILTLILKVMGNKEGNESGLNSIENCSIIINDFTTWEKDPIYLWDTFIQSSMSNIIQSVGYILYTDLLSLLLYISIVLLMVMISVIALVKIGENT